MKKAYKQLNIEERETIQLGIWARKTVREIASDINRSPATVSREIRRNTPPERRVYLPRLATERAKSRIITRGRRDRLKNEKIRNYVRDMLAAHYSPEQIAGRIRVDLPGEKVSHEAIYNYIYAQYYRGGYGQCIGEDLRVYLKRGHKTRHPKHLPFKPHRLKIQGAISIDERPKEIELKNELGHWEGDSIVSGLNRYGLNTLVERRSGLVFITKIANGKAEITSEAVINRLKNLPQRKRQTLTLDNGGENSGHKVITKTLGTKCYFCHPYHFWERGTNENTNGLIRYYFPKRTDFAKITEEQIRQVEYILNNRPRKRLKWLTPLEVFNDQSVALKR